ncbi:hypothetical protein BT96DRAFT_365588 [Gymnopus androsaceus JB14]|uniref:Nudix hydrolase domain-containing protein n=1 Tax=Gymnopus androsaceus JB14 TaxID=1447944 RepID=A0A6A4GWQ3_9AGAR|nr:hypothetical protein BT96DRAFT_365588 [Gymnopus androsaceus JB14]
MSASAHDLNLNQTLNGTTGSKISTLDAASTSTAMTATLNVPELDIDTLDPKLDPKTRKVLRRLKEQGFDTTDLSSHPPKRLAAVLILLYVHAGSLRVLLTTRSKSLRSHPGQTALPGGRVDEEDRGILETAFREANEEVGLPMPSDFASTSAYQVPNTNTPQIAYTLYSFTALCLSGDWLLHLSSHSYPPVSSTLDSSSSHAETPHSYLRSTLRANPDEVERIFTHPLEALLDPETVLPEAGLEPAFKGDGVNRTGVAVDEADGAGGVVNGDGGGLGLDALAEKGSEDWPYEEELYNSTDRIYPGGDGTVYRMHRFRSVASPIKGLTAEILVSCLAWYLSLFRFEFGIGLWGVVLGRMDLCSLCFPFRSKSFLPSYLVSFGQIAQGVFSSSV